MNEVETQFIINEYLAYLAAKKFPCIGAKATLATQQVKCMVADNMACPNDDQNILKFLYSFIDNYRNSKNFYHSAAIIFEGPQVINEEMFDKLMWQRLQ